MRINTLFVTLILSVIYTQILGFISISRRVSTTSSTDSHRTKVKGQSFDIEYLSKDPKVYIVKNFLTEQECQKYIQRADASDEDIMTASNAPQVSLSASRLWPLPFLCLGFGIPPIIKLYQQSIDPSLITMEDIIHQAAGSVGTALFIIITALISVPKLVQLYANTSSRTSKSIALNQVDDCEFIRNLVTRACAVAEDHPWEQWEAPVITKYENGALFSSHNDASPTKGSEWIDQGGQRIVTVIVYLNSCAEGGATRFDVLDFNVQPKQGSCLVFFPSSSTTLEADERTVHQSLPSVGEKYIVQLFGRVQRCPPPLGIPDIFGTEKE